MFTIGAHKRLQELQARGHLTPGEQLEVEYLLKQKYTSVGYPAAQTITDRERFDELREAVERQRKIDDLERLKAAAKITFEDFNRQEKMRDLMGQ